MYYLLVVIGMLTLLHSCGVSRYVEPLAKKEHAISVGLGGPMIKFGGAPIPIPLTSVGYGYGIDSNLTVFGGFHFTSALFTNFQVDAGIVYRPWNWKNPYIPKISFSPVLNFMYDMDDYKAKLWPQFDLNLYWNFSKRKHYVYVGMSNWFEISKFRSDNRPTLRNWIPIPQVGLTFKERSREYSIEMKLIAPGYDNRYAFISYASATGKTGATGVYFNFVQKLNWHGK